MEEDTEGGREGRQRLGPGDKSGRRERDGRWAGPFYKGSSECAQKVLLVTAAEDVTWQDPKDRPQQMPEY